MDIRSRLGSSSCLLMLTSASAPSHTFYNTCSFSSSKTFLINIPFCSSQQNGNKDNGDKSATDWDKAWSKFKKQGKKPTFSRFNPNKYVSWNPRRSEYPLSEEVDPIKRAERSNLMLWTSPRFTLGIAIVIVTFLLIYTLLAPIM